MRVTGNSFEYINAILSFIYRFLVTKVSKTRINVSFNTFMDSGPVQVKIMLIFDRFLQIIIDFLQNLIDFSQILIDFLQLSIKFNKFCSIFLKNCIDFHKFSFFFLQNLIDFKKNL